MPAHHHSSSSSSSSPFKVIIAGGGIGGLTLASALDKAGVDFVLLEKRRDVAPWRGASITSLPCTTVIHEQLGFGPAVAAATVPLLVREQYLGDQGRLLSRSDETRLLLERCGRPMIFLERHFLLEQLYNSIGDKAKVVAGTGVASYTEDDDGVLVRTDRGDTIRGSVLVGADGVKSVVRTRMAEALRGSDPAAAQNLLQGFTTKYRCIFATSHNHFVNDPARVFVPESTTQNVYYRGVGGLASAGVPGLLFWFMYLPVGSNDEQDEEVGAASYTDADCEAALAQHGHRRLGPNYTFRDLYDSRVRPPVMTAMEEGVVRARWNSGGRVVLLGDAVHKATANLGMGGNCAIDGVCYLVNELLPLLHKANDDNPAPAQPSTAALTAAFDRYEAQQRPRADFVVKMSGYAVRLETMETWWLRLLLRLVLPWVPTKAKADFFHRFDSTAPRLNFLPAPAPPTPVGGNFQKYTDVE